MCGLTGFWDRRRRTSGDDLVRIAGHMSETLQLRGPDDAGAWADAEHGLVLGFRRLAIVDLSPAGHQPMRSADGRFAVAYNGEIYNYRELRAELEESGVRFKGASDTEVMLEGFSRWGVDATVQRLNGMFAIALWDRAEATLHLVRDRLGIKPLYWAQFGSLFLFGSELKALRAHPECKPEINQSAVSAYLRFGYVPAPHTVYRGVHKLEPGRILKLAPDAVDPAIRSYWDSADAARNGRANRFAGTDTDAVDQLEALLRDAVGRQMEADVPLGAFLSGGVDSSTVAALMQAQSSRPVRTFTIGFEDPAYNEAEIARSVAAHLGTAHTEVRVTADDARAVIPRLPEMYDEPFADSSQIPTFLLSEMTRRQVTVALSGDGGDELFAGYSRYVIAANLWSRIERIPSPLRSAVSAGAGFAASPSLNRLLERAPRAFGLKLSSGRLEKLGGLLRSAGPDDLYCRLLSQWRPGELMPVVPEAAHPLLDNTASGVVPDFSERMRFQDLRTYLPDDILTKVDRASMAVSLEARVPLLDHRVVEFAWRLPAHLLVREGTTKWLLRQVLYRHVPRALVERPKMGFSVPIGAWLKGPLRDWAEDLLSEKSLMASGLQPEPVRERWRQHVAGAQDWQYPLWTILMLQAWMRRWA